MDNKQIVDDVQIRGCGHYWNGTCHAYTDNTGKFLLCVNSPNCYFKQLKRKEQECEKLKEDKERWKSNFNGKVSAIEELLQQLDQLKAKNIKIYKTLTEIKEIAEKDFSHTCWETYASQLKQILQKISECKGEYNEKIR